MLIAREPGELQDEIRLTESADFDRILIVGLTPRDTFTIGLSSSVLSMRSDSGRCFISSNAGTLCLRHADILPAADIN